MMILALSAAAVKRFRRNPKNQLTSRGVLCYNINVVTRGCSSLGRALEWHSRGSRFDPDHLHQRRVAADDTRTPLLRGALVFLHANRLVIVQTLFFIRIMIYQNCALSFHNIACNNQRYAV